MKKLFLMLVSAVMATSCVYHHEVENGGLKSNDIQTKGNVSVVTTADGQKSYVTVDPVQALDANVMSNDTLDIPVENLDFGQFSGQVEVLSEKIVRSEDAYFVKELECELKLWRKGVTLPIKFKRQVVGVRENGKEYVPYYSFDFALTPKYKGAEAVSEGFNRSYFDLNIEVSDRGEKIGTLETTVGFYAPVVNIGVTIAPWEEVNIVVYL